MYWLRISCVIALLATAAPAAGDGLQPGVVLNESNWQLATNLLPPEILDHYKSGEYANTIGEWKDGAVRWSDQLSKPLSSQGRKLGRYKLRDYTRCPRFGQRHRDPARAMAFRSLRRLDDRGGWRTL